MLKNIIYGIDIDRIVNQNENQNIKHLKCELCLKIPWEANGCKNCGEIFCKFCIERELIKSNNKCPKCNENFISDLPHKSIKKILNDLIISCKFSNCKEKIEYNEVYNHEENCEFKEFPCGYCNVHINKTNKKEHEKNCKILITLLEKENIKNSNNNNFNNNCNSNYNNLREINLENINNNLFKFIDNTINERIKFYMNENLKIIKISFDEKIAQFKAYFDFLRSEVNRIDEDIKELKLNDFINDNKPLNKKSDEIDILDYNFNNNLVNINKKIKSKIKNQNVIEASFPLGEIKRDSSNSDELYLTQLNQMTMNLNNNYSYKNTHTNNFGFDENFIDKTPENLNNEKNLSDSYMNNINNYNESIKTLVRNKNNNFINQNNVGFSNNSQTLNDLNFKFPNSDLNLNNINNLKDFNYNNNNYNFSKHNKNQKSSNTNLSMVINNLNQKHNNYLEQNSKRLNIINSSSALNKSIIPNTINSEKNKNKNLMINTISNQTSGENCNSNSNSAGRDLQQDLLIQNNENNSNKKIIYSPRISTKKLFNRNDTLNTELNLNNENFRIESNKKLINKETAINENDGQTLLSFKCNKLNNYYNESNEIELKIPSNIQSISNSNSSGNNSNNNPNFIKEEIFINKQIFKTEIRKIKNEMSIQTEDNIRCLLYSEEYDEEVFLSGHNNGHICLWNLDKYSLIRTYKEHTNTIWDLKSFSKNKFLSASSDFTIKLWDLYQKNSLKSFNVECSVFSIESLFSYNNSLIAFGGYNRLLTIFDLNKFEKVFSLLTDNNNYPSRLLHLEKIKLKNFILTVNYKDIKLWNLDTQKQERSFSEHTSWVYDLEYLQDELIASASNDKTIRIWNINSEMSIRVISLHIQSVNRIIGLYKLINENWIITGASDNTIKIIDYSKGIEIQNFSKADDIFRMILVSNTKKIKLISCGNGNSKIIKIWGS